MSQQSSKWNAIWYSTEQHPLSLALLPLSWLFRLIAGFRRRAYANGLLHSDKLPVPVIIVGNISVGGTGKTPLVIWLVKFLQQQGHKVGVISRGYGGQEQAEPRAVKGSDDPLEVGDEPVLIAKNTACPVYVFPKRFAAGQRLLAEHECDLLICDDGLQHYALHRDLEFCVIDGNRRHGNQRCLPSGPLREPVSRLKSVDAIICNGQAETGEFEMQLTATKLHQVNGEGEMSLEELSGQQVHAVAGIGNPQRFFTTLRELGLSPIEHPFDDHHYFSEAELSFDDQHLVIMTEKDAVKCRQFSQQNLWYLSVEASLPEIFQTRLANMLKSLD